jgi:hypothetical protein
MTALDRIEGLPVAMRHPAWRWNVALLLAADLDNEIARGTSIATDDHYIGRSLRFCKERQDPLSGASLFRSRYPDIYEAYLINMSNNPTGGYKWQIEAMLMTDVEYKEIANNFMLEGGEDTIRAYAKLFFDIETYRHKECCVLANVLSSSLAASRGMDDFDYTWKAFAYAKGYDNLRKFLKFKAGFSLPPNLRKWFDTATQDRVAYGAYSSSSNLRNMYNHQALAVLDVASRYYTVANGVANKLQNTDGDTSTAAKEILGALQEVILNPRLENKIAGTRDEFEPIIFTPVSKE